MNAFLDRVGFRLSVVAQKTTLAIDEGKRSFTAQMPVFNKGLDALMKEVAESFPFQEVLDVQGVIIHEPFRTCRALGFERSPLALLRWRRLSHAFGMRRAVLRCEGVPGDTKPT